MSQHIDFWRVIDGAAYPENDRASVDAEPRDVYGSIEAAIIHGGVQATAFKHVAEQMYEAPYRGCADFKLWVPSQVRHRVIITAQPKNLHCVA